MLRRLFAISLSMLLVAGCGRDVAQEIEGPGKKIRYAGLSAKVRGLDPGDVGDTTSTAVASQCYECLYQYHYLKQPSELIPCLAEDMPKISDDFLTYTIPIRRDVYFVDAPCFPNGQGRQLKADDFIYAWKRIANVKYVSSNWWIFDERIVGLNEFREYTKSCKSKADVDYDRPVAGLKALDDFTLQITLTKPWPQIVYLLAHLPTAPMAREAVEYYGDKIINVAIGTGPFMLKYWRRGSEIIFVRNPKFRKEYYPTEGQPGDKERGLLDDAGKRLPMIDGIAFLIIEELSPRWYVFRKGRLDASVIPKDFFDSAVVNRKLAPELAAKGMTMVVQNDPSTYWYGFNMEDPVVGKNRPLRRAMSMAWDREKYIEIFRNGRDIPAKGIFPPVVKGYDPNLKNPWCELNLERAREQIKEAEAIAGGKITVTLSTLGTDPTARQMGVHFQRAMKQIGVTVNVEYCNWPRLQEKFKSKAVQVFDLGWMADYPDGENFLQLFYGPNEAPGPNNFNYKNDEFDKLYRKIQTMQDTPERLALYRRMERMVCDDCPAIFSVHGVFYVPYYKYLKNYKPPLFAWGIAKYNDIDLEQRKSLVGR